MTRISRLLVFALAMVLLVPAFSQATQWRLDEAHTKFFFEVRHTYALVRGQFDDFSGSVRFDPAKPEDSEFMFTIPVKSINTNISKRDGHLLSDDFFAVRDYPLITFKSNKVAVEGNTVIVEGLLKIKDVGKNVTLRFNYFGETVNPLNPEEIVSGMETTLTINRLDYHVGDGKFYGMGVVGRDVDITVTIELLRNK